MFGTVLDAFPDKYNEQVYSGKAAEMVQDEIIDLDNLSEDDLAAVAELEAERRAETMSGDNLGQLEYECRVGKV